MRMGILYIYRLNNIKQVILNGIDNKEFKGTDAESMSIAVWSMLSGSAQFCMSMPNLSGDDYAAYHVKAIKLLWKAFLSIIHWKWAITNQ